MDANPATIHKYLGGTVILYNNLIMMYQMYMKTYFEIADGAISSRFSILHSSKNSKMGLG